MGGKASVKVKDHGRNKLMRSVGSEGWHGRTIFLGIQGKEAAESKSVKAADGSVSQDDSLTVGAVAAFHELGLGVPERSWLRGWVDENHAMILDDMRRVQRQIILGKLTPDKAAEILGLKWQASIQERITRGIDPPLEAETIARKGSSTPLIDTGQIRSAITYLVEGAKAGH